MKKLKGFTLVELLVVIAIIGILATVVVMNVSGAQKKARENNNLNLINDALKVATGCIADEGTLTVYASATDPKGAAICTNSSISGTWPTLSAYSATAGAGWSYKVTTDAAGTAGVTAVTVDGKKGDKKINCPAVGSYVTACTLDPSAVY